MFERRAVKIPGVFELFPRVHHDNRGKFVKVFQHEAFASKGLETHFAEEFYSTSRKGVIRGLHFQTPPFDHTKLVFCTSGKVQDVVVDLRKGSPTYGQYEQFDLSAELANIIYIPTGIAHGFCVLSHEATMVYKTSTNFSVDHDAGILWDSVGVEWQESHAVVSVRDQNHVSFSEFISPFDFLSVEEEQ